MVFYGLGAVSYTFNYEITITNFRYVTGSVPNGSYRVLL